MSTLSLLLEACSGGNATPAPKQPQSGKDDETASTTRTDTELPSNGNANSTATFGTSELVQALTKSMEAPEQTEEYMTQLLSQWTKSKREADPQQQPPESSLDTTLFLLHLHKLEHQVRQQEQSIQGLKHTVLEQQDRMERTLNRILATVDKTESKPQTPLEIPVIPATTRSAAPLQPADSKQQQQQTDQEFKLNFNKTETSNPSDHIPQVALHPSSIFSKSIRTLQEEPPLQLPSVHHDPARPTILSMLVKHQSPVRQQRQAARARGGTAIVKRMPPRSKIAQGPKAPIGIHKPPRLEIAWKGSGHETTGGDNMPRAEDVFTDDDNDSADLKPSLRAAANSSHHNNKKDSKHSTAKNSSVDDGDAYDFHGDEDDTTRHDDPTPRAAGPTGRRGSDFHPPSPPPKNRAVLPRIKGVMAARRNSASAALPASAVDVDIVPTQSNRMRMMHISCLTIDTALPSHRELGAALKEVVDLAECSDQCGEKGTFTGTLNGKDLPEGFGTMAYNSGALYKGEWKNGQWHGNGSLQSPNGDTYQGDFVYDTRHGRGIYKYTNDDVYEGDFTEDKRHGKGTFLFHNGTRYRGDFVNGNFEGFGWYEFDEGYYEGEWKGGNYGGIGTLQYKDGSSYTGRFVDGIADGMGEEMTAEGERRTGVWKDGELIED